MAATFDIEVPRNGDYFQEWQLRDSEDVPIDLTDHTLAMSARPAGGDPSIVATAAIEVVEAANGQFTVRWRGSDFDGYGNVFALTLAAYDLKHTFPDGIVEIPARGHLLIIPEATV